MIKNLFIGLTLLIVLIIGSIYALLFTRIGNDYIASYIENRVNSEQNEVKLKVNDFILTFNTINFDATIDDNSYISITGDLKLFKKIVDLKYNIMIKELANVEKLIGQKLNGPFFTSGAFEGNQSLATIDGISTVADSKTHYKIDLVDFEPKDINFTIKEANIEKLLVMLNQPIYTNGIVNLTGDIKNIKAGSLDGNVTLNLVKGKLNNDVINKEFKQTITSNISYKSDINALLLGNKIEIKSDLISNIVELFMNKTVVELDTKRLNSDYKLDFKNLSSLQGIIGQKLTGNFETNGNINAQNNNIKINGNSNIFESNTSYDVNLVDSILKSINFKIENGKIDKLLHMLNEPVYAVGDLEIDAKINDISTSKQSGQILTKISNGKLINEVVNAVYKQNLQERVDFDTNVKTNINETQAHSIVTLNSSIANLTTTNSIFTFKDSSLNSDYKLLVPSLDKLSDLTGAKMRGNIEVNGKIQSSASSLFVDGASSIIGGNLNFALKNNDLSASLKEAQIKDLTYMLYYPETFDSKADLDLTYDTLLKKGKLTGNLLNGHFLPNDFSNLINQLAQFDLTREIYEIVVINSDINDKVLNSTINMKSANTTFDVTSSTLDLEKSTIEADIIGKIKKLEFGVNVSGPTNNPKIKLDTKDLLKNEVNKQLEKNQDKLKEKLNKKLGEEGSENVIKNIKSLF